MRRFKMNFRKMMSLRRGYLKCPNSTSKLLKIKIWECGIGQLTELLKY